MIQAAIILLICGLFILHPGLGLVGVAGLLFVWGYDPDSKSPSYTVITCDDENTLIEKVNDLMNSDQGWVPCGGVSVSLSVDSEGIHHERFSQALTSC
jgi:hypothetical protein